MSSGQQQFDLSCSDTLYIKESISTMKSKLDELNTAKLSADLKIVEDKLGQLHALISSEATKTSEASNTGHSLARSGDDKSHNLIIYGVKEDKDTGMWRTKVDDDILEYVVGRAVGVSHMFRIGGKHVVGKCRPVLVKLLTCVGLQNCT